MGSEMCIRDRESAGGIVGDSFEDLTIENSLFIGTLSANYKTAPIVSDLYTNQDVTTVVKSYWDSEVAGIYSADYGEARTTSELQCSMMPGDAMCDVSLYAGWNETIWDFGSSTTYPILRWDFDQDGVIDNLDVDIDNDGLIEISTLQQLDLVRYDFAGTSLNGNSTGCPSTGCNGYELSLIHI